MKTRTRRTLIVLVVLALCGGSWLTANEMLGEQEGLKCTACHDKAGSKRMTDEGKYFEVMGTMEGYDKLMESFGKCTSCHVRKPGSMKLTRRGRQFQSSIEGMADFKAWLIEGHPMPEPKEE